MTGKQFSKLNSVFMPWTKAERNSIKMRNCNGTAHNFSNETIFIYTLLKLSLDNFTHIQDIYWPLPALTCLLPSTLPTHNYNACMCVCVCMKACSVCVRVWYVWYVPYTIIMPVCACVPVHMVCVCVVCVVCSTHSYNACICMRACLYVCSVCVHACVRGMFLYTTHIHGGQRTTWEQRLLLPPFGSWESNSGRPSHLLVSSFTHWAILY